jgi:hypothetical protein
MKLFKSFAILAICGVLSSVFSGCAWSIGDSKGHSTTNQPTRGQELIDLKRARDQGAISDGEYQAQKQQILSK